MNETQVLVSFVKPHKAMSSSTVSRWLKQIVEIAGIDTVIFKGHSTPAPSSTKENYFVVSISDIIKQRVIGYGPQPFKSFI